jgi:RNA polymerase sigma factor (sigma-70 family)
MRYSEQFMEHIEYAFHAFCKVVLRHEAINAWRDLKRKMEREISLDYLMSERYFEPSVMDSYFEKRDKPTVFLVLAKEVIVDDERLATALSELPELRQEVLLLYYFVGYRDEAIGRLYGRCRSTINHTRNVALKQLRKEWRDWNMRNKKLIPFEVIEKAVAGELEAVDAVLRYYTAHIKYLSMYKGYINDDTQDRLKAKLVEAILKFRFDR